MIDLQGLGGKLKTLLDRITAGRAALIDNVDATVTSRAPAATALSSATWSSALATLLGGALRLVRAEIVTVTGQSGVGAGRKFADITIAAAAIGKTVCFVGGTGRVGSAESRAMVVLTSATNLRLHYVNPNTSNNGYKFQLVLIEFA